MRDDFAIYIITHGRPDVQKTLFTLLSNGCTYDIYLVVDDMDQTKNEYFTNYNIGRVLLFNKSEYIKKQDSGLTETIHKFAVFARNAVEDIARRHGYKFFMVIDDDVTNIRMRYDDNGSLKSKSLKGSINEVLTACVDYMESADIACLSFGTTNMYRKGVDAVREWSDAYRLGNGAFIRNTKHNVTWRLNMSEDLITAVEHNKIGQTWLVFTSIQIDIDDYTGITDKSKMQGGNADVYKTFDKFKIMFLPLLVDPSCSDVRYFKDHWKTVTHARFAVPKIVSDKYKR